MRLVGDSPAKCSFDAGQWWDSSWLELEFAIFLATLLAISREYNRKDTDNFTLLHADDRRNEVAILVGIDGTDGWIANVPFLRNLDYDTKFSGSWVRMICRDRDGPNTRYFRGPVAQGAGLVDAMVQARMFIRTRQNQGVDEPIILTGYSRGAAAVVAVAKWLGDIPVEALMLFDCVDRHVYVDSSVIPNNVQNVLHVRRHPQTESRISFGSSGTKVASVETNYDQRFFMCTHGGMGGCPWELTAQGKKNGLTRNSRIREGFPDYHTTRVTFAKDKEISTQVFLSCLPFMRQYGFWRSSSKPKSNAKSSSSPSSAKYIVSTRSSKLNVREGPGTSYKRSGSLARGTIVNVVESRGKWRKLVSGGWVHGDYLRTKT